MHLLNSILLNKHVWQTDRFNKILINSGNLLIDFLASWNFATQPLKKQKLKAQKIHCENCDTKKNQKMYNACRKQRYSHVYLLAHALIMHFF